MSKPYIVEFTVRAVVMADDQNDAYDVAESKWSEIRSDNLPIIDVEGEVTNAARLPRGWDLGCIPYGGDGYTRLDKLIPHDGAKMEAKEAKNA